MAKARLAFIELGTAQRAGAVLDAKLYNELVEYAQKMDVDVAWLIRHALRDFADRHRDQMQKNPRQLAFDLKFD